MNLEKIGPVAVYRWKVFHPWQDRLVAAFTTRTGGSSNPPLESLNLGHRVNDDPKSLKQNRDRIAQALELGDREWAVCNQIHGTEIVSVTEMSDTPYDSKDAIYLDRRDITAAILLADCHPVIVYDPTRHVVVAAHAGWRGTVGEIAGKAVNAMLEGGSRLEDLVAAAGPGIGPCCYRVGAELGHRFRESFGPSAGFIRPVADGDAWFADIEEANIAVLKNAGVRTIGRGGFCTACRRDEFYSHRKEKGLTGRHAAIVMLR